MNDAYCVISFASPHYAMAGEYAVSGTNGIPQARLIPLPPEISYGCGLALRVSMEYCETAVQMLQQAGVEFDHLHRLTVCNGKRLVQLLR